MLQQDYLDDVAEQAEVKVWIPAEYEAGRAARISGGAAVRTETVCWRMGWQDANVSLTQGESAPIDIGRISPGSALLSGWSLYAVGQLARHNGLPFADDSSEVWKCGWIQMDIHLGVAGASIAELILFRNSE